MGQANYVGFHLGSLSFYANITEFPYLDFASLPTMQNLSELFYREHESAVGKSWKRDCFSGALAEFSSMT